MTSYPDGATYGAQVHETFHQTDTTVVSDEVLIAVLLSGATGGADPLVKARELLLAVHGDLVALARPGVAEGLAGLGPVASARLQAATELYRRALRRSAATNRSQITTAQEAYDHFRVLGLQPYESATALYLDTASRPITSLELSRGTNRFTIVEAAQVLRPAIQYNARAFILFHNHPSGDPEPSGPDLEVTRRLDLASKALGVLFLDHLVVGRSGSYVSLAERGLLSGIGGQISTTGS